MINPYESPQTPVSPSSPARKSPGFIRTLIAGLLLLAAAQVGSTGVSWLYSGPTFNDRSRGFGSCLAAVSLAMGAKLTFTGRLWGKRDPAE